MIIGECPNCEAQIMNSYGGSGVFHKGTCESCKKPYWLQHSNIDPVAYTEEGFNERFIVDPVTKTIKPRELPKEAQLINSIIKNASKEFHSVMDAFHESMIYGTAALKMKANDDGTISIETVDRKELNKIFEELDPEKGEPFPLELNDE